MSSKAPHAVLESEQTKAWLRQFALGDQHLAAELLKHFVLVSRDEFATGLRRLVLREASLVPGPIALYAERELPHRYGVPHRLFREGRRKVRRAEGRGPQPVMPTRNYDPSVGSEGLVAQLITELCRERPMDFLNHPGPNSIRKHKVRRLWILTDLIGSGTRAERYLTAAWRVRSVRSWWSGHFIRLGVVAYACTEAGERHVRRHHSKPDVRYLVPCPTITSTFGREAAKAYYRLCSAYDPLEQDSNPPWIEESLGFGGTGALIAFSHGAPNNTPRIFHKSGKGEGGWTPLFPARVTAGLPLEAFGRSMGKEAIAQRLRDLGQKVLAKSPATLDSSIEVKKRFLVLAALSRRPRFTAALATRTGLTTMEVVDVCDELFRLGWIDSQKHLTDSGCGELQHAKRRVAKERQRAHRLLEPPPKSPYYPSSLRSPTPPSR
ncbi:phosphoribosyltransferase-like protein [Ideonella sp. YS5]|uniref:phosphoribosyltransferase-like protein n=1 Tax=Ideonella sp. YS5 TaxID=3453714 RepID=UPI003EEAE00F